MSEPTGFYPKQRTRRVECDWLEPGDGAARLWAEVRCDLPLGVIDELPFGQGHSYADVWQAIWPYVLDWNAEGWVVGTEERIRVLPPAEQGPDAFKWVDPIISDWLAFVLKTTYRNVVSDPKAPSTSEPSSGGPSKPSAPASDSSSPANASPPSRKGSRSSSAST